MTYSCPNQEALSAYLEQALSKARMDKIRRHLELCAVCQKRLTNLTQISDQMDAMLQTLPQTLPSSGFDAAFWSKVAHEKDKRRGLSARVYQFLRGWRPWLAAGAAAGLLALIIVVNGEYGQPTVEEAFIAEHMEMLSEFEIIERLDLLENWEAIQAISEQG